MRETGSSPLQTLCALGALLVAASLALFLLPRVEGEHQDERAAAPPPAAGKEPAPEEAPNESDFVRFVENVAGAQLQSAIVTYRRPRDGVRVHLVGALHIGEKDYYRDLAKTFEEYDALLYELIGDEPPRPGETSDSVVSLAQRWIKGALGLEFQLDAIDYSRRNFIHADLDPATFLRLSEERGESFLTLILRALRSETARAAKGEEVAQIGLADLVRIFISRDRTREMKLVLARQFDNVEATLTAFEGEQGSVILGERNRKAIEVLERTIERGAKEIGIFYGAGHLMDLERRLIDDLGFERTGIEWRVAWDMPAAREADERARGREGQDGTGSE